MALHSYALSFALMMLLLVMAASIARRYAKRRLDRGQRWVIWSLVALMVYSACVFPLAFAFHSTRLLLDPLAAFALWAAWAAMTRARG